MVPDQAMTADEYRFLAQGSEPVGAGTVVNQHDVFAVPRQLVLELHVRESGQNHLSHGTPPWADSPPSRRGL
jgi:hypothetical protein